jgi:D-xylose transport system substrate-binding protein
MTIKKITIFIAAIIGFFVMGQKEAVSKEKVNKESEIVIGLSVGTLREDRWIRDVELFTEKAKELGAMVNVLFASNDSNLQLSQLENLMLQGVDVIVVVPQDAKAVGTIIEKAHKAGIKILAYDRLVKDCDLDFYVSFDSVKVGEIQAKGVLDVVGRGKFAYIGGSADDNNAFLLKEGAMRLLGPKINSGEITLAVDTFIQDWKPEESYKVMKAYLDENKSIDAVVAANDGTAFGVIQALREHGLAGRVPVSGQDAELGACQRVVEGTQVVTVYKPLKLLAYKAAEIAVALAKAENPETNSKINNGKIDVSAYLIEPVAVNKDNMVSVIINDGFHSYEQVYKNKPNK